MFCITDPQASSFVNFLLQNNILITYITTPDSYFRIYGTITKRSLSSMGERLAKYLLNFPTDAPYPRFVPMNLYLNDKGEKHATMLTITTPIDHEEKAYRIEFFDSNGEYDFKKDNKFGEWHRQTILIIQSAVEHIKEKTQVPTSFVEVMKNKKSINLYGGGNCDAISLYYVFLRFRYNYEDIVNKILVKLTLEDTKNINNFITSKSKKGGLHITIPPTKTTWNFSN
jgi:hypothetical protein